MPFQPGQTHTFWLFNAPTGLTDLAWRIEDSSDVIVVAESTTGVNEYPAGSGNYRTTTTLPTDEGEYKIVWHRGTITAVENFEVVGPFPHVPGTTTVPSAQEIREWSDVEFGSLGYAEPAAGETDRLDIQISRAVGELYTRTGIDPSTLDPMDPDLKSRAKALLAQEAIQRFVEYSTAKGQMEILETAADNDLIQSLSVSSYSETRRNLNQAKRRRHPWPLLAALIDMIVYFDNQGQAEYGVPTVAQPNDPNWNIGAEALESVRYPLSQLASGTRPGLASSIFLPWWLETLPATGGWMP